MFFKRIEPNIALHACFCHRFGSQHSPIFSEENLVDVAEVNQWRWLEESRQWLENVDQTHLAPAGANLVIQKGLLIN